MGGPIGDVGFPERFHLLRRIGEGGMGIVYEALDQERGARIALKTIRNLTGASLARFKREFRSLQDVHHPNLVSLGELIGTGEQWFFTMELVEGTDFLRYVGADSAPFAGNDAPSAASLASQRAAAIAPTVPLRRLDDQPLPFHDGRLRSALRQLALGLHALHAAKKVHRDVKPSNVLVAPGGRVVLLDFGLVAELAIGERITEHSVLGTPEYMAPEQAATMAVGPAADWYSVGVVLYEALTGRLPFSGKPLEILIQKQAEEPPPPRALVPGVPQDLDELCTRLLRTDPGKRPSSTEFLRYLDIRLPERPTSDVQTTEAPPFVGRAAELDSLRRAWLDVRQGQPVTLLVSGPTGVGKSALVGHFVSSLSAQTPELVALSGRCYVREAVPYKAFDGIVDALAHYLSRLSEADTARILPVKPGPLVQIFPVLRRVEAIVKGGRGPLLTMNPLELRRRAFDALREMLARLADWRPLLLSIDDLQWADADSLALLNEIMRPPDAPVLLLLGTFRTRAAAHMETGLITRTVHEDSPPMMPRGVRVVAVEPMTSGEGCELAELLLKRSGQAGKDDAMLIAQEAEGHPLFIDALVQHRAFEGASAQGTLRMDDALWSSITRLGEQPRALAELLAVAGMPISQELLAVATGTDLAELHERISLLRVARVIRVNGLRTSDTVELSHDRVRAAVASHLDADERARCHRTLAMALERTESRDVVALGTHWRGAGDVEQAAKYAELAADEAMSALAFNRAVRLYRSALDLSRGTDAQQRALYEKLGDANVKLGRGAQAASAFQKAANGAPSALALDLQRRAADQLLRSGNFDKGLNVLGAVIASMGARLPSGPRAALFHLIMCRILLRLRGLGFRERDSTQITPNDLTRLDVYWLVALTVGMVDTIRGAAFQGRTLLLALRTGEPVRVARALATEVAYSACGGGATWRRTRGLLGRLGAVVEKRQEPELQGWLAVVSGTAHYLRGSFREGLVHLEEAHTIFQERCMGMAWELDTVELFTLSSLAFLGRLKELHQRRQAYLRTAAERRDLYAGVNLRTGHGAIVWLAQDRPHAGRRDVEEAIAKWSKKGFHLEHYYALLASCQTEMYAGLGRESHRRIRKQWPALERSMLRSIQSVRIVSSHLRARCALATVEQGDPDREARLREAERDARAVERDRMAWGDPFAKLVRAGVSMLRRERGHEARAVSLLRDAIAGFDLADMALYAATTRRCLGLVLGGEEGRALVDGAAAWMTSEGVKDPARMSAALAPGFNGVSVQLPTAVHAPKVPIPPVSRRM